MHIRPLQTHDIQALTSLQPEHWGNNLQDMAQFHLGWPYFYAAVGEVHHRLVAFGVLICHGKSAWLGNIIVDSQHRRQGFGQAMTEHLMDYAKTKGCHSQSLYASAMGAPIYKGLGFQDVSECLCLKGPQLPSCLDHFIRPLCPQDIPALMEMDQAVMGEDRRELLQQVSPYCTSSTPKAHSPPWCPKPT